VADLADSRPAQLSGGQQQRVAVARVLAGRHLLVLADEPTGSLDRENAQQVVSMLRLAVTRAGGALLLATHDEEIAAGFTARLDLNSLAQATS
jgi:ABC-type lipoprotein export system ATPase subunit